MNDRNELGALRLPRCNCVMGGGLFLTAALPSSRMMASSVFSSSSSLSSSATGAIVVAGMARSDSSTTWISPRRHLRACMDGALNEFIAHLNSYPTRPAASHPIHTNRALVRTCACPGSATVNQPLPTDVTVPTNCCPSLSVTWTWLPTPGSGPSDAVDEARGRGMMAGPAAGRRASPAFRQRSADLRVDMWIGHRES